MKNNIYISPHPPMNISTSSVCSIWLNFGYQRIKVWLISSLCPCPHSPNIEPNHFYCHLYFLVIRTLNLIDHFCNLVSYFIASMAFIGS